MTERDTRCPMSTDLPLPPPTPAVPEKESPAGRPRGGGRGDAPSVMPVNRLYLQARRLRVGPFLASPDCPGPVRFVDSPPTAMPRYFRKSCRHEHGAITASQQA